MEKHTVKHLHQPLQTVGAEWNLKALDTTNIETKK